MTCVAARVRIQADGNRQRRAAPQRAAMTRHAAVLWTRRARHVLRVIEANIEALFESIGKSFARRIVAVHRCVTDRAHRNIRSGELRQMATGASFVSGKTRTR